jgi:hypothetical protein
VNIQRAVIFPRQSESDMQRFHPIFTGELKVRDRPLKAMLEVKQEVAPWVELQIVAFPQEGILSYPNGDGKRYAAIPPHIHG